MGFYLTPASHRPALWAGLRRGGRAAAPLKKIQISKKTVEKPASERLMENVHMQGFRNPEE